MNEPEIKVGQHWQEVDPRFKRRVVEILMIHDGKATIQRLGGPPIRARGSKTPRGYPVTLAKLERFNGKRGGYRLIKEAQS